MLFEEYLKNLRNGDHRKLGKYETKTIEKSGKYKQELTPFLIRRDCLYVYEKGQDLSANDERKTFQILIHVYKYGEQIFFDFLNTSFGLFNDN